MQDVPDKRSLEYPKLYEPGQLNLLFNKREFFICIAQGIYTSVVLFFVPFAVLSDATQSTGVPLADYQTFAVTTATALVIVVSVQVSETRAVLSLLTARDICIKLLSVPSLCINCAPLVCFACVSVHDYVDRS